MILDHGYGGQGEAVIVGSMEGVGGDKIRQEKKKEGGKEKRRRRNSC